MFGKKMGKTRALYMFSFPTLKRFFLKNSTTTKKKKRVIVEKDNAKKKQCGKGGGIQSVGQKSVDCGGGMCGSGAIRDGEHSGNIACRPDPRVAEMQQGNAVRGDISACISGTGHLRAVGHTPL